MSWLDNISLQESKEWQEVMLSHSFDLGEWEKARFKILELLHNDRRTADEASIRSYISCCAESIGSVHPLPDLGDIVNEFYQKYGMESSMGIPD